jgi:FkbM family methyltransferase
MIIDIIITSIKREIKKNGLKSFYIGLEFSLAHLNLFKNKVVKAVYLFFSPTVIRDINGFKMSLDLREKGIHEELFFSGKRELLLTNTMLNSNLIKKGDVILEIGANIGYYALIESKLVGESGKVYAVEPVSDNLRNLRKNVGLNRCKNIEFFHLAMGDFNGTSTIYVSDRPNWSSMLKGKTPGKIISTETVPISTVDEFLRDKATPNLIRMDVEGYEYNIIRGMKETLKKDVKVLIEFHEFNLTKEQIEEFFETFRQHGYGIYFSIIDINEKPSKIRMYLIDKFKGRNFGFLNLDMESLSNSLIEGKCSNPHICFIKPSSVSSTGTLLVS